MNCWTTFAPGSFSPANCRWLSLAFRPAAADLGGLQVQRCRSAGSCARLARSMLSSLAAALWL